MCGKYTINLCDKFRVIVDKYMVFQNSERPRLSPCRPVHSPRVRARLFNITKTENLPDSQLNQKHKNAMTAVALPKPKIMPSMQHPMRKSSHRNSISPPRHLSLSDDPNEESFSYEDLAEPAEKPSSWYPRIRQNPRKTKMGSKHQRKYSSGGSISDDSASSLFYVDPFGNDCENVEELENRGRTIEQQRAIRRSSLPRAVCTSEMQSSTTAPKLGLVLDSARRESMNDDDGTEPRRRAQRRRSVAGDPRRRKAVDADSMTEFNMSMNMSRSMHG